MPMNSLSARAQGTCKNLKVMDAKAAEPTEFEGTLVARAGNIVRVKLNADSDVPPGAHADLLRYFEGKPGEANPLGVLGGLLGGNVQGWMSIARVTVGPVKNHVVALTIVEERSKITVNGRKTNHFTPAARVKLTLQREGK